MQENTPKIIRAVIANFVALHFNEEIKHTDYYKGNLKKFLRPAIIQLQKSERKDFDLLDNAESELLDFISSNQIEFIKHIVDKPFTEMAILQNMIVAYRKDPKRIEGIVNKVLNE